MKTIILAILLTGFSPVAQQGRGTLVVEARSGTTPVSQVEIAAGDQSAVGNERGEVTLQLPAGNVTVTVQRLDLRRRQFRHPSRKAQRLGSSSTCS